MDEQAVLDKIKNDRKWIVIVDDQETDLHMVAWMFIEAGEAVAAFTDGKAALDFLKLRSGKIKCALLDLSIEPTMDGFTLAEQIRLNEQTFTLEPVRLAFYTSHRQSENGATERIMKKYNVEKIFHKPEDTPELVSIVNGWLYSHEPSGEKNKGAVHHHAV